MLRFIRSQIARNYSGGELIVAAAIFMAFFSNTAFFTAAHQAFGTSAEKLVFIGSLFFHITAIFVLVLSALCHRVLVKPVIILFLMLGSVIAYFANTYGTIVDHHMIANALQTDSSEARDLFNPKVLVYVLLLGLLPSLVITRVRLVHPHWKTETIARIKLAAAAGAVLVAAYLPFTAHYASLMREHRDVVNKISPTFPLYSALKYARHAAAAGPGTHIIVGADAKTHEVSGHRELVIMVVGETARADHWGLNGYSRDTTPLLRQVGVVNFPDVWSCDTSTAKSVPCMFSNLGRANFDAKQAQATDNLLDLLNRSGVSVLWRDNNSSSKGVADRVMFEDFKSPRSNTICDGKECRDEGMLVGLQDYIDKQPGDIMIVLHQMGNHGPAYYKRYPKEFEKFTPVCSTNDLGSCTSEEIRNAYDNAILYTDYFLSKVIELLKMNDSRFETAMYYVSDHGESLGEYGVYLHGTPYMIAPDTQKHVPAVMWFGEGIKHDLKLDDIEERRKRHWSHDNVFSTLLGLFEIESAAYDAKLDILEHAPYEARADF